MRTRFGCRYGVLALALIAVGCGGGDGDSGGNPSAPTPPPSSPGAASIAIAGERGAQSFNPNPATVAQGSAVTWRNNDTQVHRIVSNDGTFDTGDIAPGATSAARTVQTNGGNYHCANHPTMIGAINGSGGAPPPCTGPYCE